MPERVGGEADAGREGAAGAEAEVVRDDDAEEQPEADDVQADDRGGQAARARPLGRRQRAADARQHASSSVAQAGHSPAIGKWVKRGAVAERVEHRLAHARRAPPAQRRDLAAALAQDELARAAGGLVEPGPVAEVHVAHEAEALEDLEVAVGRGDVAVAGELLRAQRPVGVEQRLQQQPARGRQAQAAGADGGEGGRGGRRLHRRREVWDGHERSSWSIAPPAWRVLGAIAHDPQERIT